MKPLWQYIILLSIASITLNASTIRDVKILEASENIKYITQNIAKNYTYLYICKNKNELKNEISGSMKALEENIKSIALNTKDVKIKYILDFFVFEKEQVKLILEEDENIENASQVLDFSEALTEGAENIFDSIRYKFTFEEQMLIKSKKISFLVEKLTKYYMVLGSDIDKSTIKEKTRDTMRLIEREMKAFERYIYPKELNIKKNDMEKFWKSIKYYFSNIDTLKVPSVMLLSASGIQEIIGSMAIFHGKRE